MTRIPGPPVAAGRNPVPDIYSVLLLIGILFLLIGSITVCHDLLSNYGLSFKQLFYVAPIPM